MKQCMKRYLALILTFAMVFTMLPSTLVRAEGEGGTVGVTQTVKASKFVVAGSEGIKDGTNGAKSYLIGTSEITETGNEKAAAYVADETGKGRNQVGSCRVAGLGFALPQGLDAESIANASVEITIFDGNDVLNSGMETKAGLFRVAADKYEGLQSDNTSNAPGATFPALDGYTKDKTVYGDGWIFFHNYEAQDQKVTFDVTNWIKEAVTNKDANAVFRLQTVMGGFYVYDANAEDLAPALSITTMGKVSDSAIASYDFDKYQAGEGNTLTDGTSTLALEAVNGGKLPELAQDERRGQVLSLTEQNYDKRGYALLPSNPFAGKSVDNGFTLSFWTKSKTAPATNRCLLDFEVAPAAAGKRAGTVAVNQSYVYWNTTDQNENFMDFQTDKLDLAAANGWVMVTMAITKEGVTFYRNNQKISHNITSQHSTDYVQMIGDMAGTSGLVENAEDTKVRIGASLATYWHCAGAWIDDISFYDRALSDGEVSALYNETYVPVELQGVTVSGPKEVDEEKSIQLTRTLAPTDATVDTTTIWKSSDESVLKIDANGKATGLKGGKASVTATVAGITSEPYEITVNKLNFTEELEAGKYLTVYSTTKAFYANAANLEQETRSVYMAVSKDGKEFEVLNNGGGVIFSKNTSGTLRVTEPKIAKVDGKFTVVAKDSDTSKGFHKFTSADGVNYYDDEIVQESGIADANLKKSNFKLMLHGENILNTDESITLGNALKLTDEEYTYIVNKLGTVVNNGLEELAEVDATGVKDADGLLGKLQKTVNATYTDGSVQKFNIDWSEAVKNVDLTKPGSYELTGNVIQTQYINKLKELNGSSLPDDDPANVGVNFPDNYDPATGTVYYDKTKFVEGMADPCIYWDEQTGYYYMTGSYFPESGDEIDANDKTEQYDRVVLRRARTLEGLQSRKDQVTIWKVGNQGYTDANGTQAERGYRYIWAPEIHRVGDNWVVYFTESHSSLFDIFCHVLVLPGDQDPYETALTASNQVSQWKDYKMTSTQANDPFNLAFCLDMTYFKDEVNGTSYVIWAGKPTVAYQGTSTDLFIATVDESQPWKITSAPTRLTKSDYGWERVRFCVNEGATILQHDGNVFMCYSVSGTGSEYAIGMCNAKGGADLLDINNWTKSPYPLLTSRDVNGEEGPGHNSFTVDQDGNAIFVYHARPTSHNYQKCGKYNSEPLNDPCRHARLKRVHWSADGTPILKMTYENELLDQFKTVKVKVKVGEPTVPVASVKLSKTSLTMYVKDKAVTLKATVSPSNATDKAVTWNSSNVKVAKVDANGKVTPVAKGTATITAKTANGKTATCKVTVKVHVTKVTLSKKTATMGEKGSLALTATVSPSNANDKKVTWKSSKTSLATVSSRGVVKAKKAGKVKITAKADGKSATCTITIKKAPTKITVKKPSVTIKRKKTYKIKYTLKPSGAMNKVTYSSNKKSVATVSKSGVIKGVKKGTAVITVKTYNKKTAKIKVRVK